MVRVVNALDIIIIAKRSHSLQRSRAWRKHPLPRTVTTQRSQMCKTIGQFWNYFLFDIEIPDRYRLHGMIELPRYLVD